MGQSILGRQLRSCQKGGACVGKTKRGKGTKIMLVTDANGLPVGAVGRGGVFGPGVAARLADFFAADRPAVPREVFPALADREREMLHLMAQGASNAEIAPLLSLRPKTVANYVSNILHKLQVADRKEAAVRAREARLGQDKP